MLCWGLLTIRCAWPQSGVAGLTWLHLSWACLLTSVDMPSACSSGRGWSWHRQLCDYMTFTLKNSGWLFTYKWISEKCLWLQMVYYTCFNEDYSDVLQFGRFWEVLRTWACGEKQRGRAYVEGHEFRFPNPSSAPHYLLQVSVHKAPSFPESESVIIEGLDLRCFARFYNYKTPPFLW